MSNPPRIWLDYRPVRIGWVISGRDVQDLVTAATWNTCLWGGGHNCIIPAHDIALADNLMECFGVDVLLPVKADEAANSYIDRFPHLRHHRWLNSIFERRGCEFADIRHPLRRIVEHQDTDTRSRMKIPVWEDIDPLHALLTLLFGRYPAPDAHIIDYKGGIQNEFGPGVIPIAPTDDLPFSLLEIASPLGLTSYDLTRKRDHRRWLGPGVIVGSVSDFDALAMFWNLRAAGAQLIYYDQAHSARLKGFANAYLAKLRSPHLGTPARVCVWIRRDCDPTDNSWRPDLELGDLAISLRDGRGETLWNGMNVEPNKPHFSGGHRDVVPSYAETEGKASASFALPDRPFNDEDVQALTQKFAVIVDASQFGGPDAELTFDTPFMPHLNRFYGRNFYRDFDAARSQLGHLDSGALAIITEISTQQLSVNAFRVFDWMKAFFQLCRIEITRSEAGLRCSRLIAQLGGLQDCRVLKIRGVRTLLRKYGVDQSFTRSGAQEAIRDVDPATNAVGFDEFKNLYIEFREQGGLKADDVFRYLLQRRVFRVGLEFTCPNCRLPSWIHLDDVKTRSTCGYCDYVYDVTPQLKDRDWRYRRSGIFGREDEQLGGVPVALTLQQLASSLHQRFMMYSAAMNFRSAGAAIEPCESDYVGVVSGALGMSESPVQIVFGEAKTEGSFDAHDVRKLGALADAVPRNLAQAYILFSKTGTFSPGEIAMAKTLNTEYTRRVILWSRDELEPFYPYERSQTKLGERSTAGTLTDMANVTQRLYFSEYW
jgi:hypothetical protein